MKEVEISALDINDIKACYEEFLSHLCINRRNRLKRYFRNSDRLRCAAGGFLLKFSLCKKLNTYNVHIEEDACLYGKPILKHFPEFRFNISHSSDWVVIACSDVEMGIDIEKMDDNLQSIANTYFHQSEFSLFSCINDKQINSRLYDFWTIKESIMKASGLGFRLHPKDITITSLSPVTSHIDKHEHTYHTKLLNFKDAYSLAVSATEDFNHKLKILSLTDILNTFNYNQGGNNEDFSPF